MMPPPPTTPAARRVRKRLATVPAAFRDDHYYLIDLLDRQQGTECTPVSGLAASLPAGGRRFRARGCLGRI